MSASRPGAARVADAGVGDEHDFTRTVGDTRRDPVPLFAPDTWRSTAIAGSTIKETTMRVLLVEDEAPLRETLAARLKRDGFAVDAAGDGEEGLYLGREVPFDVAIIDLGLPKLSGMDLVKQLREAGQRCPILILTARSSWQDKVQGLKNGADDYLVKPFHVEELLARLNALVRRASGWSRPLLECGPITLDTTAQTVTVNGQPVDLTSYEYKVLEYLMLHAGELVSKADLTEHIYQQDFDRDSNVLEVFIGRLRRKLDPDNAIKPIETVRGRGYRFALERTDTSGEPVQQTTNDEASSST